jgi:hypothetical protein
LFQKVLLQQQLLLLLMMPPLAHISMNHLTTTMSCKFADLK